MSKYLVTGGCGFIGSHLVDALLACGCSVRILDNLSTGKHIHKSPNVELIIGDVADPQIVAEAMDGMEGCFHLAAVASVQRSEEDWLGTHRVNSTGAIAIFDAARKVTAGTPIPVVYASSAAVYGDARRVPISENAVSRPLSAYGSDKLGCELHGYVASRVHGVPTCGLRFFNVYGPRQDPKSDYSGVISIFCDRLTAGREVTVYGDGFQTRDFIYVGDVVSAMLMAINHRTSDSNVFNVCSGIPVTVNGIIEIIARLLDEKPHIVFAPSRKSEIRHSVGNPNKARRALGFSASIDLAAGLTLTLRSHGKNDQTVNDA